MSLASGDPRHGTNNGYVNLKCRCDACRDAYREYQRAHGIGGYMRVPCPVCGGGKRPEAVQCQACYEAAREAPHGTENRAKRCRCDVCRVAAIEARRRRRHATRAPCSSCGALVDTQARRNPDKPLECRSCANRRTALARWASRRG